MKQPADNPQPPDDSTEELSESDDDEPKESHQSHQVTCTGRVSRPSLRFSVEQANYHMMHHHMK